MERLHVETYPVADEDDYHDSPQVTSSAVSTIPDKSALIASPIHTLPIELLSRVFVLGAADKPYPDLTPIVAPTFEVLVSHVCRHWRDVALRTQSLWTTLTFRLWCHRGRALEYLARNNRLLLDIFIDTCAEDEYEAGYNLFREEFMPLFHILIPHVDRWRSLTLKVRDRGCKLGARTALSTCGAAKNLQYLQLWHIEDWDSAERLFTQIGPPPVVIFDRSLPSLKHLSLVGVNVPWLQSPFLEDLASIDFALHSEDVRVPYHVWANMLATSPNLEKMSLHYSGPKSSGEHWPETVIPIPGLKELSLTDLDPPYMCEVLRRLHIPNVAQLRLELPAQEPDTDFDGFLAYLVAPPRRSEAKQGDTPEPEAEVAEAVETDAGAEGPLFPHLRTLAVSALECSAQSFRRLLEVSPHVTQLELGCKRLTDGLFQELFHVTTEDAKGKQREGASAPCGGVQRILLPDLHTVRISGVDSAALVQYIEFRRRHGPPVKRWHVSERMRDPELERVVQEMEQRGEDERIVWFTSEEDEEDDEDEEDEEDDDVGSGDGTEEQEGAEEMVGGSDEAHASGDGEGEGSQDDEREEYSDEEEAGDIPDDD